MDFLFINSQELSALMGLPHIQQSAYLLGIRPYMDRKTFLVGLKRRISYQSLAEALYVEPHQGFVQSGSPSRQQLRRIVCSLERAGLLEIQSFDKNLVLKCLLADSSDSVQNKPDTNPTQQPDTKTVNEKSYKSERYGDFSQKPNIGETLKPDTPHNSNNLCVYVRNKFEKFWESYPQKVNRCNALLAFEKLNPSDALFEQMISALQAQIEHRQGCIDAGIWVPKWKYPENWLAQLCWLEEIEMVQTQERQHATNKQNHRRKSAADVHSEACKGVSFDFEDDEPKQETSTNVIQFGKPGRL
ncbi:hypothetical protein [Legionella nagasakiensis]|uniref:hypothetical protein n=1 Tax=Legionella nagasakiensis TaxID=535290 RepID=UPI001054D0E9|nr:hypothetical protein [Legionella nagasakiensis]